MKARLVPVKMVTFIYLFICAREKQIECTDEFERNSDVQMFENEHTFYMKCVV